GASAPQRSGPGYSRGCRGCPGRRGGAGDRRPSWAAPPAFSTGAPPAAGPLSRLLRRRRDGSGGQLFPHGLPGGDALRRGAVPRAPETHIEGAHIFLAVAGVGLGGVGAVAAQVQAGENRAVGPAIDHIPPVIVRITLGQAAV